jgi:hypothetical protein
MKQFYPIKKLFFTLILLTYSLTNIAQNAIAGAGFTNGWPSACNQNTSFVYFNTGAGTSYTSGALTPRGTGNQFWRMGVDWSGTIKQMNNGSSTDVAVAPGTKYTLNSACTGNGAFFRNVSSTSNRYIFKTLNAGTNPTGDWVFFELGGAPITISSVSQSPTTTNVTGGQTTTVTANLSGALPTGQGVYLRYTSNNYSASTVVQLSGSGTSYTTTIPGSFNTTGANVSYYLFTSGSGLTISAADADLYTINLNNNGGSNYTYTVLPPPPTITLGGNPTVCRGVTSASLSYSATTNSPNQYSIVYDTAAISAGFSNVTNATLPASPITITVPGNATPAIYNANLTVRNTTTNAVSVTYPITITVTALPTAGIVNNTGATNVTCAIPSISLTATGGTSYSWSNGTSVVSSIANLSVTSVGTYTVTVTSNGCSSTANIVITQDTAATSSSQTVTACDTYLWSVNGTTYTASGTYTFVGTNAAGCVDTKTLNLTINSSSSSSQTVTACDTYTWSLNGQTYTTSGTYTFVGTNAAGCPDTKTLVLTINNSTSSSQTVSSCDTYTWSVNEQTYTSSGTYTFTGTNAAGCPDTKTLVLTIYASTPSSQTVTACDTYTWSVNGQTYTSSGTYVFEGTNAAGCSQNVTLNLTINSSTASSQSVSACDTYTWSVNGQTYTASGTYTFVGTNAAGCPDTKTLVLTINNSTSSSQTVSACETYTWTVNEQTYTTSGTYSSTGTNAAGCPDTKTLILTINTPTSSSQTVTACDTYTWTVNGQTYTTSGTYVFEGTNAAGCSQNVTLNLTINSSTSSSDSATACDTYTWSLNGQTYTESGTYTFVGTNAAGCPDTKTLVLTINNSTSSSQTVSACETYTWTVNEQTYTTSGTYTSTSTNAAGCPDTKTLVLTINTPTSSSQTVSACNTYTWSVNGQTYTESGTYTFVGTNAAGCTDTKTLNLTINSSTTSSQTVTACQTYTWSVNGTTYTSSGTYTFVGGNAAGCTDTKTLVLTIEQLNRSNATSTWTNGQNDSTTGFGAWTLTASGGTAGFFSGSSDVNNGGTRSWGMFASGGDNVASAIRPVTMGVGNTLSFSMDNGFIDTGKTIGFGLQNSAGENLAELIFTGGQPTYRMIDANSQNTTIGYTGSGLDISLTYTGLNTYSITVSARGGSTATYTGRTFASRTGGQRPAQIRFFNAGAGTGSNFDLFFNSLAINNPVVTTQPLTTVQNVCVGTPTTNLEVAASGSGLTYQWYSSTSNTTYAGATNLGTAGQTATLSPQNSSAGTLYYYCIVTGPCGSTYSNFSGAVTVTSPPNAGTLSGIEEICVNGLATFSTNGTTGGSWSSSAPLIASVNNAGVVSGVSAGSATITYTLNGTGGCTNATATRSVTVNPLPTAGITNNTGSTEINCSITSISVTATGADSYSWSNGTSVVSTSADLTITAAGTYTVTVTNSFGCTSTASITITENKTTTSSQTVSACDSYTWSLNGQTYTISGNYTFISTNEAGCVNTATLNLTITPSTTNGNLTATACDTYTWSAGNGATYTEGGTYTYVTGCNTATLNLTITPSSTNTTEITACDSYYWPVTELTYTDSDEITETVGCVTETLVLTINNSTSSSQTISACDTYTWSVNEQTYTSSGTYTFTGTNAAGCPDTKTLVLTIYASTPSSQTVTACDTYTWTVNGQTYTTSGTYVFEGTNAAGCSQNVTLNLTINSSTASSHSVSACDTYTWSVNGQTYTASGTYTFVGTNAAGCPDTKTLVLTINNSTSSSQTVSACETYTWTVNEQTYTTSGTYSSTGTNAAGCPDTKTLILTINTPTSSSQTVTACDTYTWTVNGQTYTTSGTYVFEGTNAAGCSQNVTLNLTINSSTSSSDSATACDTYTWSLNGQTYTESGTYTFIGTNAAGCPDTKTLVLTINNSTSSSQTVSACETYTWTVNEQTYTTSGTYSSTGTNAAGCPDTKTLVLTINTPTSSSQTVSACNTYTWSVNGQTYTESGTYTFVGTNAAGCTDTKTLNLTINSSTTSSQTVTACQTYTWSVNGTTYTSSGTYTFVGGNAAGCTDTKTLVLTIEQLNRSNATSTWTNGQNDSTTGFGAWTLTASGGTAGFFSGSSDVNNGGTRSWGMFASGGDNVASAIRPVTMGVGNTLSFSMDNGFIDTGKTIGFGLQNSAGENLAELIFTGGQPTYRMIDANSQNTTIGYTGSGLDISLTYTGLNTYSITVSARGGSTATYTGRTFASRTGGQRPAQIRFFNAGAGTGSNFDLFFNSLAINNPVVTTQPLTTVQNVCVGTPTTNLEVAASGSGLTYQWYSSTSNTTYAGATNLGTAGQTATLSPQNSSAGTLYYYCIVTGPCGSTYSNFSGAVTVTSPPNAGTLSGIEEICVNGLATFSTNGTTGGSWSSSAPLIASVNNAGVVSGVSAGSATITYTLNGTGGCTNATATRSVTVNPLPTAGITNNTGSTEINCSITSISVTATGADSYSWSNGTSVVSTSADLTITAAGTYTVTVTNSFGCTSTASITITENKTTTSSETVSACDSYTWSLNGQTYAISGNYTFISTNEAGCVNTATLNLTITPSTTNGNLTATACDTYTWSAGNGATYTESGTYTYVTGCNTATLNLTITPSSTNTTEITACDSYYWPVTELTYTDSDEITETVGCVTETLVLTINNSTSESASQTSCDTYTWSVGSGDTYTSSGTYTFTGTNAAGCPHTQTLNLTINNSTSSSASETACDSYTWTAGTGTTYNTSGTYTSTGLNAAGCTDTKTLVLTINNSTSESASETACDSYTWSAGTGDTYTASGTYTSTSTNAAGCTHTKTLVLTINNSSSESASETACDSYTWTAGTGTTYTASGTYTSTGLNAAGCTLTKTLVLTINNSTSSVETVTSPTCGTYTWSENSTTYTSSGTYTSTSTNAAGCPNTKTLVLTINPCESVVTIKMNIQGYYDADAHAMRAVMANQGVSGASATDVDDVTVELRDSSTNALVVSTTARLKTDGTAIATFGTAPSGSFYIAVKHRNSLETWSATAQTVGATPLTYDFTTAANKAYGNNMIQLESGVYGFYSGDLNQDGFIESGDYPSLYNDSDAGLEGYYSTDLNGDGFVESGDYPILFNNSDSGIEISRP